MPPVLFDIVFQFDTVLTIVINSTESVINVAGWEYKTVFFAMGYNFLKNVFLSHSFLILNKFSCKVSASGAKNKEKWQKNNIFCSWNSCRKSLGTT
ncbi:hypothetical protein EVA_07773 [gut metagenome]|uniref:Uncharacterized protein n=1 Tax=gut metagenome TaxID=749906 RepID=J9GP41_9ZZZZ